MEVEAGQEGQDSEVQEDKEDAEQGSEEESKKGTHNKVSSPTPHQPNIVKSMSSHIGPTDPGATHASRHAP